MYTTKLVACKESIVSRIHVTTEQIINLLRKAEVTLSKCRLFVQICKTLVISKQSFYLWRKEYGSPRTDQAKKLREVLKENVTLKKAVHNFAVAKSGLALLSDKNRVCF